MLQVPNPQIHLSTVFATLGLWAGLTMCNLSLPEALALAAGLLLSISLLYLYDLCALGKAPYFALCFMLGIFISPNERPLAWRDWHPAHLQFQVHHLCYNPYNPKNVMAQCTIIKALDQWDEPISQLQGAKVYIQIPYDSNSPTTLANSYGRLKITATGQVRFKAHDVQPLPLSFVNSCRQLIFKISLLWQMSIHDASRRVHSLSWGKSLMLSMIGLSSPNAQVSYALRRFGLSHFTAISGLHFALIAGLGAALLKYASVPMRLSFGGILSTLFLLVNSIAGSSARAWLMNVLAICCLLQKRSYYAAHALAIATFILLCLFPSWSTNPGFILSVVCTAILIALSQILNLASASSPVQNSKWEIFYSWCALQGALFALSLPLQFFWFGSVSWLSIPANMLLGPLFGLLFAICILAGVASLLSPTFASWIFHGVFLSAEKILHVLSQMPHKLDWRWQFDLGRSGLAFCLPLIAALLICLLSLKPQPYKVTVTPVKGPA